MQEIDNGKFFNNVHMSIKDKIHIFQLQKKHVSMTSQKNNRNNYERRKQCDIKQILKIKKRYKQTTPNFYHGYLVAGR